ncbi:response regulator transcription factor [Chitinophaga sp. 212800010-3]|uniref:response regulator transcription factor n=1 Tax=unclassified Chitinophaga TaxID=2619133 RepID=UPI002DE355DB|nr:Two component transcriptional regulator, LuxR family [Chitinophaga sp. 212800010-3]
MNKEIKIAIADDHALFRRGITSLINFFPGYKVLFEAADGKDFIRQLRQDSLPDIALLDISMPNMDGYATAHWINTYYPQINVLALSTMDAESAIIRMMKNGAKGYVLKDAEPEELKLAFDEVLQHGCFYNEQITRKVMKSLNALSSENNISGFVKLTERETEFLKLLCTEKTYNEIAAEMFVSPRTAEGYRNALCEKLQLKSRTGLVLYAIKNGLVKI